MRVIIAAAGQRPKWGGYLGVPPHLVQVDGWPLLSRTIGQARKLTTDVHVTCPDDDRYRMAAGEGAVCHVRGDEGNEYTSTRDLWLTSGRTVLLLGDVFFSDEAIATIGGGSPTAYRCFGRAGASKHTGTPYGEIFAASWGPQRHDRMDAYLAEVARLRETGACIRPPGWVLLRLWQGTPVRRHQVQAPFFTEIDDLTDDLDKPADYDRHPRFGGIHEGI